MAITFTSLLKYCYGVSPELVVIKKSTTQRRRPKMINKSLSIINIAHNNNHHHPKSITTNSSSLRLIKSPPTKNKVFEDQSKGIVCYREDNGEITCEGIDEGPRFHQICSITATSQSTRDAEMVDLLQRCWRHIVDKSKLN